MRKIYLSGPITGLDVKEYHAKFERAESFYKEIGFEVVNPVRISDDILAKNPDAKYEDFMKADLEALKGCSHIAMLDGWEKSNGARIEKEEATLSGLTVCYYKVPEDYEDDNELTIFGHKGL